MGCCSRGSLIRTSALGVDGGASGPSLESLGEVFSPFLTYKASVIVILHRLFILIGCSLLGLLVVLIQ